MLRRHREIRMQIHQLMDACLFAISFWLAVRRLPLLHSNINYRAGRLEYIRLYPID